MKQLSFAIPVSKMVVLADLEHRFKQWDLPAFTYALLERWYEAGWEDGMVTFDRRTLAQELGMDQRELDEGIDLLQDLRLISVRRGAAHEVAELLALSSAHRQRGSYRGWWQMYLLEFEGNED